MWVHYLNISGLALCSIVGDLRRWWLVWFHFLCLLLQLFEQRFTHVHDLVNYLQLHYTGTRTLPSKTKCLDNVIMLLVYIQNSGRAGAGLSCAP